MPGLDLGKLAVGLLGPKSMETLSGKSSLVMILHVVWSGPLKRSLMRALSVVYTPRHGLTEMPTCHHVFDMLDGLAAINGSCGMLSFMPCCWQRSKLGSPPLGAKRVGLASPALKRLGLASSGAQL